jgi:hypothetical protein
MWLCSRDPVVGDFLMEGADMIDYLHSIGAKVQYWVVNDAGYMQRLLAKGRFCPQNDK